MKHLNAKALCLLCLVAASSCAWMRKKPEPVPTQLSSLSKSHTDCGLNGPIAERIESCKTHIIAEGGEWELVTRHGKSGFELWKEPETEATLAKTVATGEPPPPRFWTSTFGRVMSQADAMAACQSLYHENLPIELNWHVPTELDWKQGLALGLLTVGAKTEEVRPSWNWYWSSTDAGEPELDQSEIEAFAVHRKTGAFSRKAKGAWNWGLFRCLSGLPLEP